MRIVDLYCLTCNETTKVDAVLGTNEDPEFQDCPFCGLSTRHAVVCAGGVGSRYHYMDMPSQEYLDNCVTAKPPTIHFKDEDGTERPAEHVDGGVIHNQARFHGDGRLERRDRNKHKRDAGKGRRPIYIDLSRSN